MASLRRLFARCGLALSLAGFVTAQDGGIEVFAAEPLFAGGSRVSLSHIFESRGSLYAGSHEIADPLERAAREHRLVVGYDRGLSPNVSMSALVPLLTEDFDSLTGNTESAGPGDVALIGKYRFHRRDWKRGTFNVAAVGHQEGAQLIQHLLHVLQREGHGFSAHRDEPDVKAPRLRSGPIG